MKKRLLFGALLMGSFLTANAQDSCDDAVAVTAGDYTVSEITGDFEAICVMTNEQADAAAWYSYTATENGLLTISSVIESNPSGTDGTDTRLTAYTGECDELVCYSSNDDQSTTDYRSMITIPVETDATYYFAWDNNWQDTAFDFNVSFEAVSCLPVAGGFMYVGEPTTDEVTIEWNAAAGSPESYTVIYGEVGFDPETEGMEMTGLTTPEATFGDLEAGTAYEFYVTTICAGGEMSEMVGPIGFETAIAAAMTPYETGFEDNGEDLVGWTLLTTTGGAWDISPAIAGFVEPYEGETFAIVGGFTAASDSWLFSRGIQLEGGTTYNISYYLAKVIGAGEGNVDNLEVSIGTDTTVAGQTDILSTFEPYEEDEYTQQGHNFTPETDGVYYVGFHYTGPAHAQENFGFLAMDNFAVTEGASTNDILASKFTVYPNPATNVINIANAENILVNGVVITDLNGRTVKNVSYDGVAEAQINVSDLAAGMYMMTVSSDKGTMTKKIVKN